jgi:tetratricopeptide (TPR) repeat protein
VAPSKPFKIHAALPDPGTARTLDELIERLRWLKVWTGNPSYETIKDRINTAWMAAGRPPGELARRGTVVDCFKLGRQRLNTDLLLAVVRALRPDVGYAAQWEQALRVVLGETQAAAQVRAQDRLPADLADFTGRTSELNRIRNALQRSQGAVVISSIEGMAGVGKTRLAVHVGHLLSAERPFEQVLFVNLRGFQPHPAQPPADPTAVLEGFLRLLGVPGHQIAHDLATRTALYRRRLTGKRALIVLDNAANEQQVQPLLPDSPDCVTIVTSRRSLTGLQAVHVAVDVFTAGEACDFLERAAPDVPVGEDLTALVRVAQRCGYLPLALGLIAGQMRTKPGWTVTDHADRLDESNQNRLLADGVELALSVSYQRLPAPRRRLLRLLALHPGHDFDSYAGAALAGTDLDRARYELRHLCVDHLLQEATPGRYAFHDLVRAYAADRATDEDRAVDRRAALTRVFDHYLFAAATATRSHPAYQRNGPDVRQPATPTPPLTDATAARTWLETERTNVNAAAVHAACEGWPEHTIRMARILGRYLDTSGHFGDALILHTHARRAARDTGDRRAEASAENNLGIVHWRLGGYRHAAEHHQRALELFRGIGDRLGEGRVLNNLGNVHRRLGNHHQAADHHQQALTRFGEIGDRSEVARTLGSLGLVHERLGRYRDSIDYHRQALALFREIGERNGEAHALDNLGVVSRHLRRYQQAVDYHQEALILLRQAGHRSGEAYALANLGVVHERLGRYRRAADYHEQALVIFREIGHRGGEAETLNGFGETLLADGRPNEARTQHAAALTLADQTGDQHEEARAHDGLAHAYDAAGDTGMARHHWQQALAIYADLEVPQADQVRAHLLALVTRP